MWPEVTRRQHHLTGSHPEVSIGGQKLGFRVHLCFETAVTRRRWQSRGLKWLTWPHVTGSDPEVTSFDRKSPRSGCRRPKTRLLGAFILLQDCNSQEVAVTWPGNYITWPHVTASDLEVTSFDRKSPGSGCKRLKTRGLHVFTLLQSCNPQDVAFTSQETTSHNLTWLKWPRSYPEVTSSDQKSSGTGCRRPKTHLFGSFMLLKGCNLQDVAVTWQEMMSCDLKWPEVTSFDRKSPKSGSGWPKTRFAPVYAPTGL